MERAPGLYQFLPVIGFGCACAGESTQSRRLCP
jgi:hypothetical protein